MWNEIWPPLLIAVLTAIAGWVVKTLIPFLQASIADKVNRRIIETIYAGVRAAEMLFPEGKGVDKLNYVMDLITRQEYIIDEEELRALIEQAVYELKRK